MNAIDSALVLLGGASNALERHQPALPDVEEARDKAKAAHEVLDASAKLLKRLIYSVTEEPKADTPLFKENGQPAEGTHTTDEAPPADAPKVVQMALSCSTGAGAVIDVEVLPPHPFDGKDEDEQVSLFDEALDQLEEAGVEAGLKRKAWNKAVAAWDEAWEKDGRGTFTRLEVALARNPITWNVPDDAEVAEYQRKQALAAPDPTFDQAAGE